MIKNDHQLGKPFVQYTGIQATIEALTSLDAGSTAYATDLQQFGFYTGAAWVWGATASIPINVYNETQSGLSGVTTYYLYNVAAANTVRAYVNGIRQPVADSVTDSDAVTFSVAPDAGATLLFDYELSLA